MKQFVEINKVIVGALARLQRCLSRRERRKEQEESLGKCSADLNFSWTAAAAATTTLTKKEKGARV